jgi:hypothetical protein
VSVDEHRAVKEMAHLAPMAPHGPRLAAWAMAELRVSKADPDAVLAPHQSQVESSETLPRLAVSKSYRVSSEYWELWGGAIGRDAQQCTFLDSRPGYMLDTSVER